MPALRPRSLCSLALESDDRAEATADLQRDRGAPEPLLGAGRDHARVRDLVPEGLDRWHRYGGVTFAGVAVAQYWVEFILWETLLNERRYNAIVEIGTLDGGFSLYLHSQAALRKMGFRTYDVRFPAREIPGFHRKDVFADEADVGEHLWRTDPVIVLCDGGNKPRELKTFSRYVTGSSTLVVHDWGTEMLRKDIPSNVYMVHEEWCEELGSASRCFRVRS